MTLELIKQRYPEIGFHLCFTPFKSYEIKNNADQKINAVRQGIFLHDPQNIEQEVNRWIKKTPLDSVQILYVYGVGLGHYFEPIKKWLKERSGRSVIFLEDDLAVLNVFCQSSWSVEILTHPQVHLRYVTDWEAELEELPLLFPSEHVHLSALELYAKKRSLFKKMELKLLRNSTAFFALLSESLYVDRLFKNIYTNFQRLSHAFNANCLQGEFQNVPAVICGAGPSLYKSADSLRHLENRALIFAGGSAGAALNHLGIQPHFLMALDPNQEELERFKPITSFEVPLLYASRLYPSVKATCNGPFGYMRTQTGGLVEDWLEKKLGITQESIGPDLGREAFSVTTLALAYAYALGCNPIIFAGVDLAYTQMKRYASGVLDKNEVHKEQLRAHVKASERLLIKKDGFGKPLHTSVKWVMESDSIAQFARNHPERLFINATEGGLGFKGIANIALSDLIEQYNFQESDLRGKIHACLQQVPWFEDQEESIRETVQELLESLRRSLHLCEAYLNELKRLQKNGKELLESGRMVLLKMDLEQEGAYECFLAAFQSTLLRLFSLHEPHLFEPSNLMQLEGILWTRTHELIQRCLSCEEVGH